MTAPGTAPATGPEKPGEADERMRTMTQALVLGGYGAVG